MDRDLEAVQAHLLREASNVTSFDLETAIHVEVHRWRFANIAKQDGAPCFLDPERKMAACGDWFIQGRIEAAFLSADALSTQLEQNL